MHDFVGEPGLRGALQCDLSVSPRDLVLAGQGERCPEDHGIHERDTHFGRGGHAGSVGVGEVEAGKKESGVRQAHAVDLVQEAVVLVDMKVLGDDLIDVAAADPG